MNICFGIDVCTYVVNFYTFLPLCKTHLPLKMLRKIPTVLLMFLLSATLLHVCQLKPNTFVTNNMIMICDSNVLLTERCPKTKCQNLTILR